MIYTCNTYTCVCVCARIYIYIYIYVYMCVCLQCGPSKDGRACSICRDKANERWGRCALGLGVMLSM